MVVLLSLILFVIFTILGLIHCYWLFGGKWGLEKALPTRENETTNIKIPRLATLVVALVLFLFGLLYLLKSGLLDSNFQNKFISYSYWFIPLMFILRAIGEFNYLGFFKKVTSTKFAQADTTLFSPLCLLIGLIGIMINLIA